MSTIKFEDSIGLIKEGDVLLFHAGGIFSIGWLITGVTRGKYSHVGLASWKTGDLTIIEQKEFKGGREVMLSSQIKRKTKIDVYRAKNVEGKTFDGLRSACVTHTARHITGQKYGWKNIWDIYKEFIPFYRFFVNHESSDEQDAEVFVCSTLVSNSYRKCYADPVPNLSDKRTTPDDLARSFLFDYKFTVEK